MGQQLSLFKQAQPRRNNGRFCTPEQMRVERVDNTNKLLRYERDKFYRMWLAASKKASRLERELVKIKEKIGGLMNG